MASVRKIVGFTLIGVVVAGTTVVGKWYHTAAIEAIHPQRGVYGMDGMEIWIDINARMPTFAREWGCATLRAREKAVLGGNSLPPYSCQEGFGAMEDRTAYQTAIDANLAQMVQGMDAAAATALKACFDAKMAAAITPEEIQGMNDHEQAVMSKVVVAISQNARACKDEAGG